MEVSWIKINIFMFDDDKIDFIESLPEKDAILVIWCKLLTLAGKCNVNGYILLAENIPYTDEMLAHKFRRPLNVVRLALDTLLRLNMIDIEDGCIHITNWTKYQNAEKLDYIREYNRLAKQKQRDKKRLSQGQCQGQVNECQDTDADIDVDITTATYKDALIEYQNNINPIASAAVVEKIRDAVNTLNNDLVAFAIHKAALNEKRSWKYINGILDSWIIKGIKTLEQAIAEDKLWKGAQKNGGNRKSTSANNDSGQGGATGGIYDKDLE